MAGDNFERQEIDNLIRELSAPPKPAPRLVKPAEKPAAAQEPSPKAELPPAAAARKKIGRWTVRPMTFAVTQPSKRPAVASAFANISFPELPRFEALDAFRGPFSQMATVRMCVGLGVLLSAAMPYWPYPNGCSWGLLLYMFAVTTVIVAGVWGTLMTWSSRLRVAHTVALAIVLWGLTLATAEVLPRIGYAKAEATWTCP
jgi:hypothetical protein